MSILSQQKQSVNTDFPNLRPSLDLRFALAKKLDPRITFTRGSTGTYFGSDGIIRTAGVNEPRFDHDPVTGQSLGLLVEESRTNLFTRSDIEGTVGSTPTGAVVPYTSQGQSVVVSTDVFLGPNGQSAKHTKGVQQNDSNTGYFNTGAVLTIGQTYCASIWLYIPPSQAKNFEGKTLTFQAENAPSVTTTTARFDTTLIGIWQRAFCVFTASATSTSIIPRTNAVAGSFFYTDCWQLELGAFPTSYMPASGGSQFTRSAELAEMTGTNFSSWYNQTEGTFFFDGTLPFITNDSISSGARVPFGVSNGFSFANSMYVAKGTTNLTLTFTVVTNNVGNTGISIANMTSSRFKISAAFADKNIYACGYGGTVNKPTRSSASIPTVSKLTLGKEPWNTGFSNPIIGHITRFTYYPVALTPTQLINLTS